jgi:WD40 repeat protein
MSEPVPHFELRRQYDDGTESEPLLFPLHELGEAFSSTRRGFLAGGMATGIALGYLPQRAQAAGTTAKTLPRAHTSPIRSVSISPNGQYLATACAGDHKLWSMDEKKILMQQNADGEAIKSTVLTGDDLLLAVGRASGRVELFTAPNVSGGTDAKSAGDGLSALGAAADGKCLYAGTEFGTLIGWSLPDLEVIAKQLQHTKSITSVATSADGALLATGGRDGTIILWSRAEHKTIATLQGHTGPVTHLAFKPSGTHLMSRSDDRTIRLWKLPGGEAFKTLEDHWADAETMTLSPNGRILLTSTRATLNCWNITNGQNLATLVGHKNPITAVAVGPDNTWAVSGDAGGVVIIWSLKERKLLSYLFDPASSNVNMTGSTFTAVDSVTSKTITYTLPCGSAIPAGAICTCNCVPGSLEIVRTPVVTTEPTEAQLRKQEELERRRELAEQRRYEAQERKEQLRWEREERRRMRYGNGPEYYPPSGGGGGGTLICTCDLIYICHASQLMTASGAVRSLAENLLLAGGARAQTYLAWAATAFDGSLRERVEHVRDAVRAGQRAQNYAWPTALECYRLLEAGDDVIATMAAQCLALRSNARDQRPSGIGHRIATLLAEAARRPWQVRYGATAVT